MNTPRRIAVAFALLLTAVPAVRTFAQSRAEELALIFRPFETDQVTLSPDGRHLAYTERQGDKLDLVIRDLGANRLVRVPVGEARSEELSGAKEKTPARLTFLLWATAERLVFNLNDRNVWSIRADGTAAKRLTDPTDFAPPASFTGPQRSSEFGAATGPDSPGLPGPILDTLQPADQPVRVIALPRGDKYVYVEAVRRDRGNLPGADGIARLPGPDGNPRGILRVDVNTGRASDWGEAEPRAVSLLADQQGRPRVSAVRTTPRSLETTFNYTEAKAGKWRPLDRLAGTAPAPGFRFGPENQFGIRSVPLAFDYNPDLLYFASNQGRNTYGVYALDLKNQQRTAVAIETPVADFIDPAARNPNPLVFDHARRALVGVRYTGAERATLWLDPELTGVQQALKAALPGRTAEVVEWDDLRERYLVFASSHSDPGVYYLFNPRTSQLDECLQRAPWLPESARNRTISFGFVSPAGVYLTGYLTLPHRPRLARAPLVALCHDGPWQRDQPGYNRWVQALGSLGFAVMQVNYRGSAGFGQKHLQALREGPDTVALADILAATDWVIQSGRVNPKLVALMGEGYGGYLALRGMQLHSERFRCAVTFNAPTDLAVWVNPASDAEAEAALGVAVADLPKLGGAEQDSRADGGDNFARDSLSRGLNPSTSPDDSPTALGVLGGAAPAGRVYAAELRRAYFGADLARLRAISPVNHPELVNNPVMIIQADSHVFNGGRQFSNELTRLGRTAVFLGLNQDAAADLPGARAALFQKIEGFLNEHIYNYSVKLGEPVYHP